MHFLSEDSVVGKDNHPLSQNRYTFALNNPFKYFDPSGHIALPYHMEDKWIPSYKPYSTSSSKGTTLKVNNVKPTTVKKTVSNISKNVVTAKLEQLYNNEVQQNQNASKSAQEIIKKNDAKNEENMSRMSDSAKKVAEEYNKNKEKLREAAKSKDENRNREVNELKKATQQKEESNRLVNTGTATAVIGLVAFMGFMSIAAIPAGLIVARGLTIGAIASTLLGVGITSSVFGIAAGLTLHNTGTKGTDLAGRSLTSKESQNRKSAGIGIMLSNAVNLLGLTLGAMDYYNANKPTVASNTNSSKTNQESNKQNQPQVSQDDTSDDINNQSSNASESKNIPDKVKELTNEIKNNNGSPLKGYKGGKTYENNPRVENSQKLPEGVNYKEYDVNPYIKGQNRGAERIVIGDDGSAWYTDDHYDNFTKIE